MSIPTFIVGTGRCGSTMLSNMLREHPKILSVSEYFAMVTANGRVPGSFSQEPITARKFWKFNATSSVYIRYCMQKGIEIDEILYPPNDSAFRFSAKEGVPGILVTTLPHLTTDPDQVFDLLAAEVSAWPEASPREHYLRLFAWLARHFHKQLWIERSGNAFEFIEPLLQMFPNARFVHLVRDGRDTARSIRENPLFRIGFILGSLEKYLGVNPLLNMDRTQIDNVPGELRSFLPECFDVDAFNAFRMTWPHCCEIWWRHIELGLKILKTLPPDRLLTLRYEDILTDPRSQLDSLAAFLREDFVDKDWSTRCAATVHKPRSTWRDLPEEEARALTEACRPGFEVLEAAGVEYEF